MCAQPAISARAIQSYMCARPDKRTWRHATMRAAPILYICLRLTYHREFFRQMVLY
eukprot:COSAG02_NODE_878_length_16266_cov_8.886559_4_plen_56_part_00